MLLQAIQAGDAISVRKLALGQLRTHENSDLLHYAAGLGNSEIVDILLNSGWQNMINVFDEVGYTPLHWAAREGHKPVVERLLSANADVNAQDLTTCGNTVLREVVENAPLDMVKMLLNAGANPEIPGWMQLTALDVAAQRYEENSDSTSGQILDALKGIAASANKNT